MPTLLTKKGFKFFFYSNDHEPTHIHIEKAGRQAKVNLLSMEVEYSFLKRSELVKALEIAKEKRTEFIGVWNEWFNQS
jgi:hypothetical protein